MDPPVLKTGADFILQLTNSVTVQPRDWAAIIGKKFPHARVHRHRRPVKKTDLAIKEDRATPGTIVFCDSKIGPGVITIFNQLLPGEIGSSEYQAYSNEIKRIETQLERLEWLVQGLEQVGVHLEQIYQGRRTSIAVPPLPGSIYQNALQTFQSRYYQFVEILFY